MSSKTKETPTISVGADPLQNASDIARVAEYLNIRLFPSYGGEAGNPTVVVEARDLAGNMVKSTRDAKRTFASETDAFDWLVRAVAVERNVDLFPKDEVQSIREELDALKAKVEGGKSGKP